MADYVIIKKGSYVISEPKQQAMLAQHHYQSSSHAQCSRDLSLLNAGQLSHQMSSKTCANHYTISMLCSKYFPHPHKPSVGYSSKLSAAHTHHLQQLISSWKAVNAAKNVKTLVNARTNLSHHTTLILAQSKQI